jgi:hypothetical protein
MTSKEPKAELHVLVIGAGLTGVLIAQGLKKVMSEDFFLVVRVWLSTGMYPFRTCLEPKLFYIMALYKSPPVAHHNSHRQG